MSSVEVIQSVEQFDQVLDDYPGVTTVMVYFTATWSADCRLVEPHLAEWATKYSNVPILKVDFDELKEIALRYSVSSVPTTIFLSNGEIVKIVVGHDVSEIEDALQLYEEQ